LGVAAVWLQIHPVAPGNPVAGVHEVQLVCRPLQHLVHVLGRWFLLVALAGKGPGSRDHPHLHMLGMIVLVFMIVTHRMLTPYRLRLLRPLEMWVACSA